VTAKEINMTSGKRFAIAIGIGLLTAFGSLSAAHAQYGYGAPPRGVYRQGLVIGASLGGGDMASQNCGPYCGGSGMIEGHIGGMLNPRLALMADLFAAIHPWDDGVYTGQTYNGIYTLALQYWVTDIIWLKGGMGFAHLQYGYDGTGASLGDESAFALMGAGGVEILQSYNFAVDLQFRIGNGFYSQGPDITNYAFMIGVNWY
jgi:hypothetical protein